MENGGAVACVVVLFFLILLLCVGTGWSNYRTYTQCKRSFMQTGSYGCTLTECDNGTVQNKYCSAKLKYRFLGTLLTSSKRILFSEPLANEDFLSNRWSVKPQNQGKLKKCTGPHFDGDSSFCHYDNNVILGSLNQKVGNYCDSCPKHITVTCKKLLPPFRGRKPQRPLRR